MDGVLQTLKLHTGEVTSCDFNGNYLLAIGSGDKKVGVLEWKPGLGFVDMPYSPLSPHKYGITSVRFSPKGVMLASSSFDGTAVLHDVQKGTKIFTVVQPSTSGIRYCEFTPDSSKLVTAGEDGVFCFWDLVYQVQIRNCRLHDEDNFNVRDLAISPDSEYLLSADSRGLLKIWFIGNIKADEPRCLFSERNVHDGIYSCDFSSAADPENTQHMRKYIIATCGADGLIYIWKVEIERSQKGQTEYFTCNTTTVHTLSGHVQDVLSVRFNPNGDCIASTGLDNTVKLWEVASGNCLVEFKRHKRFGTCSAFSKDSALLATGSNDQTVIIWNLNHNLTLDSHLLKPCNVSSHFTNVDLIKYFTEPTTIKRKNDYTSNCFTVFQKLNSSSTLSTVQFHGNEFLAVAGREKNLRIWKRKEGGFTCEEKDILQDHKYNINHLDVSACGSKIISCSLDDAIVFCDLNMELTYKMKTPSCTSGLRTCKFSPNSAFIAAAGDDQKVFLWNASSLEFIKVIQCHEEAITSVGFTPDSEFLVSTCCAGVVMLYNFEDDKSLIVINNAHDLGVMSCDFSNGTVSKSGSTEIYSSDATRYNNNYLLATCGNDSLVKLWQVSKREAKTLKILSGHGGTVNCVRFSPDEPFILASCGADGTARIWHAKSGCCLDVLSLHQKAVTTCSFSQNSSMFATGSLDKTVVIWTLSERFCPEMLEAILNPNKAMSNWATSNTANWFLSNGCPEIANKIKENGKKCLECEDDLILDMIDSGGERKREALTLELNRLKKEPGYKFNSRNIPHKFLCPVTHEIMKNPVICSDGFTYDRDTIIEWLLTRKLTSPMTNEILTSAKVLPNLTLKRNIFKFLLELDDENQI